MESPHFDSSVNMSVGIHLVGVIDESFIYFTECCV